MKIHRKIIESNNKKIVLEKLRLTETGKKTQVHKNKKKYNRKKDKKIDI